jgi:tRNA pseudouridine55 synthase
MQGILLVDKPAGWTSFDVVNYVRRIVAAEQGTKPKNTKVGHTGTLDPFATGLLILVIGKEYTRRASEFSKLAKTYEVTMRLGQTSSTGDPEGETTTVDDRKPTPAEVESALQQFVGQIEQVPPAFSAIKINGQRAYKLARAGKEVIIEPRNITIHRIKLAGYNYPEVTFTAEVSSGTYIRSLVEDLGKALRTGAYTSALRRTEIADYSLGDASDVKNLDALSLQQLITEKM